MSPFDIARTIRDRNCEHIMALPGVVGSEIGADEHGDPRILIYLRSDDPLAAYEALIRHIEGEPVLFEVTGEITASAFQETAS